MPAQLLECITNVFTVFLLNAFVHIYICCIRYYIAIKYMHAYIFGTFAACLATSSTMPHPISLSLTHTHTHTRGMPGQLLDYATSYSLGSASDKTVFAGKRVSPVRARECSSVCSG